MITILTSIYKAKEHIDGFLIDIVNQSIFKDCVLHIFDANSPDNEYLQIKPWLLQYKNIFYERASTTESVYTVWNQMIRNANTPYLTNANVDDRLMPTCLEKHLNVLEENKDYDLAYCINIDTLKQESYKTLNGDYHIFPTGPFSLENMVMCNLPHNHPVWRRVLHDKFGYFDEKYKSAADWDFWLRCAFGGSKFYFINEVLGIYYRNPQGISSNNANMARNLAEVSEVREKYRAML